MGGRWYFKKKWFWTLFDLIASLLRVGRRHETGAQRYRQKRKRVLQLKTHLTAGSNYIFDWAYFAPCLNRVNGLINISWCYYTRDVLIHIYVGITNQLCVCVHTHSTWYLEYMPLFHGEAKPSWGTSTSVLIERRLMHPLTVGLGVNPWQNLGSNCWGMSPQFLQMHTHRRFDSCLSVSILL